MIFFNKTTETTSDKKDSSNQRKSCFPVLVQIAKYPITYKNNIVQTIENLLHIFNPHKVLFSFTLISIPPLCGGTNSHESSTFFHTISPNISEK